MAKNALKSFYEWRDSQPFDKGDRKAYNSYVQAYKYNDQQRQSALEQAKARQRQQSQLAAMRSRERQAQKEAEKRARENRRLLAKQQAKMREEMNKQMAAMRSQYATPAVSQQNVNSGYYSDLVNELRQQQKQLQAQYQEKLAAQEAMQKQLMEQALAKQNASYTENVDAFMSKVLPEAERQMSQALFGRGLGGEVGRNMPSLTAELATQAGLYAGQEKRADLDSLLKQYSTIGQNVSGQRSSLNDRLFNLLNNTTSQFQQSRSLAHDSSQRAADRNMQLYGQNLNYMSNLFNNYARSGGLFA